jgi:hypothetical protein
MYKVEPNTTRNQPSERPFLVRDTESGKINRYCAVKDEAESQASRLNKVFYPETVAEAAPAAPADPAYKENMSLFS